MSISTLKKVEPRWLHSGTIWSYTVENGTTLKVVPKWYLFLEVELKWLLLGKWNHNQPFFGRKGYHFAKWYKMVHKWGPSCGHENFSTVEPFRFHFSLSVNTLHLMTPMPMVLNLSIPIIGGQQVIFCNATIPNFAATHNN